MFDQRKEQDQLIEQQKMIKAQVRDQDRQYITDEFLDEIAAIYNADLTGKPIQAIQKIYPNAGHSTVRRWVEREREQETTARLARAAVGGGIDHEVERNR